MLRPLSKPRHCIALLALAALAAAPVAGARTDAAPRVEVVVGFDGAAGRLDVAGARIVARLPAVHAAVVSVPAAGVAALRADDAVAYAAPAAVRRPALAPNDPLYARARWAYVEAGLPGAWSLTIGDARVVVAVLDSGVDASHPDLPALVPGYDVVDDDADPSDDLGHGTLVAGALAARIDNGIGGAGACPGCAVMPVKVISGVTGVATDADIVKGIVWATDHGADVINLSLGGPGYAQVLQDAVSYATAHDVVVVAAGGNEGTTGLDYPASLDGVVGVAAIDRTRGLAAYSNHGPNLDLAAPGCVETTLRGGGYGEACGTSLAAPLVAGIAGLVRSRRPELVRAAVEQALIAAARPVAGLDVAGGLVDAHGALVRADALAPVSTSPPVVSGLAAPGGRLTTTNGAWAGVATAYSYAWERCDGAGGGCVPLAGAAAATYVPTAADVGATLRAVVTAANAGGAAGAASTLSAPVSAEPAASPPPAVAIGGAPRVGRRLTALPGSGWSSAGIRHQWQSCRAGGGALRCSDLAGRTAATLLVGRSLVGSRLRVRTTGTAVDGSRTVRASPATAPVRR